MDASERYHLLHVFPSFEVGGVQVRTTTIINSLDIRFRHSVIALNENYSCAERFDRNAPVEILSEVNQPGSLLGSLRCASQTISETKPDLLLTYNWASLDWALANAIGRYRPHIHHEDGFNADEAERQFARRIAYRRLALSRSDLLVVPSHNLYAISRTVWRQRPSKVRLIANGIDIREFAGGDQERSQTRSQSVVLGTIAPLRAEKNIQTVLHAAAALRPLHMTEVVVVGDGPERQQLEAVAANEGLGEVCRFEGLRDDVANALAEMDIFLMPSLTEQMPISLLQAMAAAKPVAAYDVGDIARMVSRENVPFIVSRADKDALTRGIERLIEDAGLRRAIGHANRERVKSAYSQSDMIDEYTAAYTEILARSRQRR